MNTLVLEIFCTLSIIVGATGCPPNVCDDPSYRNPEPLQCKGSVIKGGGYCGCSDVCAKIQGETCFKNFDHSPDLCDSGLECRPHGEMLLFGWGSCQKTAYQSREATNPLSVQTTCEQQRRARLLSMAVWRGMWIPRCDAEGLFQSQQCDNTGMCFCVDSQTGKMNLGSKVHGPASC